MNREAFTPLPLLGLGVVSSGCLVGLDLKSVTVEVMSRRGPAQFQMAGLAEAAVREARVRVGSALAGLGVTLDEFALTVSLAPADLRKSGSGLDLAIALAVLMAIGRVERRLGPGVIVLGELSLDGSVRGIPGIMPLLVGAAHFGYEQALVPAQNAREASYVDGLIVRSVASLGALVDFLAGQVELPQAVRQPLPSAVRRFARSLDDVIGQHAAKRALEVAAAGTHNLLFTGPPGAGKSLLARTLPSLLPQLTESEALLTTSVHSISGLVDPALGVIAEAPFRAPHHTVSEAGLVGGGPIVRPGEVSLAHNGVLFLDELPEFRRGALEALRQPLEDGVVVIARARSRVTFPARPMLVAAMNPCPCGHYGNPQKVCRCSVLERTRYWSRLSGPLLDRIDLKVTVPAVETSDLLHRGPRALSESTNPAPARIARAKAIQMERHRRGQTRHARNGDLDGEDLERIVPLCPRGMQLLKRAIDQLGLSARGYVRTLRVARTLADLEAEERVLEAHIAEAIGYRSNDMLAATSAGARPRSSAN
jgi:magnesium chelatase family protein